MNTIQKPKKIIEIIAWMGMVALTILALYITYALHFSGAIKAIIWLFWLILSLGLGYCTPQGKLVYEFSMESRLELQKVTWATRQETIQITTIVMIVVVLTGIVLWGVDSGMMWMIGKVTHLG